VGDREVPEGGQILVGLGQDRCDGLLQTGVGVGDDQLHTTQSSGLERAQERRPEGAVLGVADLAAEHLAATVGGDPGGDHHRP